MAVSTPHRGQEEPNRVVVAQGVSVFAGVMLVTLAIFGVLQGIAAIAKDDIYVTGLNYTWKFDLTTWGWIQLVIGAVAIVTGVAILMEQAWGYYLGIVIAAISAIANFGFLPYYPFWSAVIIAFDGFVIWALCVRLAAPTSS